MKKHNKENENKNAFLITWIACIVLLLLLCYLGVNSSSALKGTSAVSTTYTCSGLTFKGLTSVLDGETCNVTYTMKQCGSYTNLKCSTFETGWSGSCVPSDEPIEGDTSCALGGSAYSYTCSCSRDAIVGSDTPSSSSSSSSTSSSSSSSATTSVGTCWKCNDGKYYLGAYAQYGSTCTQVDSSFCDATSPSSSSSSSSSTPDEACYCYATGGNKTCLWESYHGEGYEVGVDNETDCDAKSTSSSSSSSSSSAAKQCYQCNGSGDLYAWATSTSDAQSKYPSCGGGWHTRTDLTSLSSCGPSQCYQCNSPGDLYAWAPSTTVAQANQPSCGGGWHTRTDLTQSQCVSSTTTKVTVTYNANGGDGTMANTTCTAGVACATTKNTFTKTCNKFNGWTGSDGKSYSDGASVTISSNLTLTAKWTYICGGGTTDPTPSTPSSTYTPSSSPSSNVDDNPQTGEIAIFVVWVIALAAIVYSVWYFKKVRES